MNGMLFAGVGFGVWLLATIAVRLFGHLIFLTENAPVMIGLYIAAGVGVGGIAWFMYRWQGLDVGQRFQAGVYLVLPGMLLDVFVVQFFTAVFPNMPAIADGPFGAWLLWAYSVPLLLAVVYRGSARQRVA